MLLAAEIEESISHECEWLLEAQKNSWPKASKGNRDPCPRGTELNFANTMNELGSRFSLRASR